MRLEIRVIHLERYLLLDIISFLKALARLATNKQLSR